MKDTRTPSEISIISSEVIAPHIPKGATLRYVMWQGIRLTVRTMLSFRETIEMCGCIVAACRSDEDGALHPECMEAALRSEVVRRYAFIKPPDDIEEEYRLLFGTNIYQTICAAINADQLEAIKDAARMCFKM